MGTEAMKIAMVALDFDRAGGSERRTGQLVDRLLARGHAVHLVGTRIRDEWDARVVRHRIPTQPRPHWVELVQFVRRARRLVAAEGFDVVHNQIRPFVPGLVTVGGGCHRFYLEEVLPRERGRLLAAVKRLAPLHWVILGMERRGFAPEGCPAVITNSALAREGILRYYPYPPERILVAHNGVDAGRFRPAESAAWRRSQRQELGLPPDAPLALFLGSGFARKGLGSLLEATAGVRWRGLPLRLLVVGGGRTAPWRRRAARLGLDEAVRFLGPVRDPERYYALADLFALPTHFDPFANATLEAMASALPVITTRLNGAAEIIRDGAEGLLLDRPDDVEGLTAALLALREPDRRAAMGARGRETALRHPWEAQVEATLAAYGRVGRKTENGERKT